MPIRNFIQLEFIDTTLYETTDPWLSTDEVKVDARTDRFNQKQQLASDAAEQQNLQLAADPVKQELMKYIASSLPNMKGSTDRMSLEELIRLHGGSIKPIVAAKIKPRSLYMLATSVHDFLQRLEQKEPENVQAFLQVYGTNLMDWLANFTPTVAPIGRK